MVACEECSRLCDKPLPPQSGCNDCYDLLRDNYKKLQAELLEYKEAASSEAALVNELQAENAKLRECVEFYASEDNWELSDSCHAINISLDSEDLLSHPDFSSLGGKRARQVLKELEDK